MAKSLTAYEGIADPYVIRELRTLMEEIEGKAKEFVSENFLLTRHLREYLTLFHWLLQGKGESRIYL